MVKTETAHTARMRETDKWPANKIGLRKACNDVLNYMRIQTTVPSYGSDDWLIEDERKRELAGMIRERFLEVTGKPIRFTTFDSTDTIIKRYSRCRKFGHKELKSGELLRTDRKQRPLLDSEDIGAVLYAYIGTIPDFGDVIKLGYTTSKIESYLSGKRITVKPRLLATRPGGLNEEKHIKAKWDHLVVIGNEWFRPTFDLFDWLQKSGWRLEENFVELRDQVLFGTTT